MNILQWFWSELKRTDHKGFVNAGDDMRWNPFGIPGWIQGKLSFHSKIEPPSLLLCLFPPMFAMNLPIWKNRYLLIRFGWRYDRNYLGFIFPEAVIKVLDHTQFYWLTKLSPRAKRLQLFFNLTESEWKAVWDFQNGVCPLCGQPILQYPNTDHSHKNGTVRGILHCFCNKRLNDSIEYHQRAVAYLTNPPATQALGREVLTYPGRLGTKKHRAFLKKSKRKK